MYTVDIDIGGTLTDGLVSDGHKVVTTKVDTTPHDFTVCFFDCLREASSNLGFSDLGAFLDQVDVIRWSSTISTNILAERKGPRIGLLGSPGMGMGLYGPGSSPAVGAVISAASIAEVAEPLRRDDVLSRVRHLLEQGVRRVCISLAGAYTDPSGEIQTKRWITDQYPDHFLGAVPALAGTDMLLHPDDRTRTHLALVNAYVHTPLAVSLFKAEEELLRLYRYRRPLYIGHVSGGVARVAKTKGFDTIESGPVFGVLGAAYYARRYKHDRVLTLDVGGTTAKLAVVVDGRPVTADHIDTFGIPMEMPRMLLHSVPLGGGSVAGTANDEVVLGPESMGAYPGPASYNLGGDRPTLTDAFVVAGLLDPERFLGGRRHLNADAARSALLVHVADPLGISVAEAARRVIDTAVTILARAARSTLEEAEVPTAETHLYGFGGNGALLAAGLAADLGAEALTIFGLGQVFSAFGSSVSDVCHVEEEWPGIDLASGEAAEQVIARVEAMRSRVLRDLAGEGADLAAVSIDVEALVTNDRCGSRIALDADCDAAEVATALGSGRLDRLTVRGSLQAPHHEPVEAPGERRAASSVSHREVGWGTGDTLTPIYDWETLAPGEHLEGPAVVEAAANTAAVPPRWSFTLDGFGNGRMTPDDTIGRG